MVTPAPAVRPSLAERCCRSYTFSCAGCSEVYTVVGASTVAVLDKGQAEVTARRAGWRFGFGVGWQCPSCRPSPVRVGDGAPAAGLPVGSAATNDTPAPPRADAAETAPAPVRPAPGLPVSATDIGEEIIVTCRGCGTSSALLAAIGWAFGDGGIWCCPLCHVGHASHMEDVLL